VLEQEGEFRFLLFAQAMTVLLNVEHQPLKMAQAKAELEYDKFKALAARSPRPVDADFEQATKDLKKLPKPKKPKPPKK
jgi:hypothetical protein